MRWNFFFFSENVKIVCFPMGVNKMKKRENILLIFLIKNYIIN